MSKIKVLVKIFTMEDGDEGEILRQFVVKGKDDNPEKLALKIGECINKGWTLEDVEAWTYSLTEDYTEE
jgi:hypothetical protein